MQYEVVVDDLLFPEGPVAMPDGSVLYVELPKGTLSRAWAGGRKEIVAHVGDGPNGAAYGPDGAIYICNNGGVDASRDAEGNLVVGPTPSYYKGGHIDRVDLATGKVERLYEHCNGNKFSSPNDLVFDRAGGMWFTDFGRPTGRIRDISGIYYAKADGSLVEEAFLGGIAFNGIGLSADEKTLYAADTYQSKLWSFDIESPGKLRAPVHPGHGPRKFIASTGALELDSLALTASGAICVGTIGGGGIAVVTPEDGKVELRSLPDDYVTNICFGGPDLRTAYITMVMTGQLIRTTWPEPGLPLNFLNK